MHCFLCSIQIDFSMLSIQFSWFLSLQLYFRLRLIYFGLSISIKHTLIYVAGTRLSFSLSYKSLFSLSLIIFNSKGKLLSDFANSTHVPTFCQISLKTFYFHFFSNFKMIKFNQLIDSRNQSSIFNLLDLKRDLEWLKLLKIPRKK